VWQTEVKSTLTRTSRRPGGATSTSSITSGSPGAHATAAARTYHIYQTVHAFMAGTVPSPEQGEGRHTSGEEEEKQAAAGQHTAYLCIYLCN
jgi:hypothetical protein